MIVAEIHAIRILFHERSYHHRYYYRKSQYNIILMIVDETLKSVSTWEIFISQKLSINNMNFQKPSIIQATIQNPLNVTVYLIQGIAESNLNINASDANTNQNYVKVCNLLFHNFLYFAMILFTVFLKLGFIFNFEIKI